MISGSLKKSPLFSQLPVSPPASAWPQVTSFPSAKAAMAAPLAASSRCTRRSFGGEASKSWPQVTTVP